MNTEKSGINVTDQVDIDKNKTVAVIGYILFFVPLLAAKESNYARYHANQGLVLFLTLLAINIIGGIIPIIGWLLIVPLGNIGILILAIMGIINAAGGRCKPLPLIGGIRIINS